MFDVVDSVDPWSFAADILDPPEGRRYSEYCPHWPHPPQHHFLQLSNRVDYEPDTGKLIVSEALYGGAAGGGKSDALLMDAIVGPDPDNPYVDIPGYAAIIFRRLSPDLHGADGLVERSKEWLLPVLGPRAWNGDRLRWTFPSGATLRFGHMQYEDDRHKFQGHAYQFVGWDELTHFTARQYLYMFSRCRKPDDLATHHPLAKVPLRIRGASNPGGVGHEWVKKRFITKKVDTERDPLDTVARAQARTFVPAKLSDNPSINQESYTSMLENLEPEERAQLLDGNWDARMPGDWYFEDLSGALEYGRIYEELLRSGTMPPPVGGVLHLGVDWGEMTHALLGWPLPGGGWFVAREMADQGGEVSDKTVRILAMKDELPGEYPELDWGRVFFDSAGIQSQKTFNRVAEQMLGWARPAAKSISFGAMAARTARSAVKSMKGVAAGFARRLARRANEGKADQILAISPECEELIRQLKPLPIDPEDSSGAWLKDDDQHGPDGLVALIAVTANKYREIFELELEKSKRKNPKMEIGGKPPVEDLEAEVVT